MFISSTLYKDIIMSFFDDGVSYALPCNKIYIFCIVTRICRAVLGNHETRSNGNVVRLLPVRFLKRNSHRVALLIYIVVFSANLEVQSNCPADVLTL